MILPGVLSITLAEPFRGWAQWFASGWLFGCVSYRISQQSKKDAVELSKNALLICLGLALYRMLWYGSNVYDSDDEILIEGFPTTFDSKAGAAMRLFFNSVTGCMAGIHLALFVKRQRRIPDDPG